MTTSQEPPTRSANGSGDMIHKTACAAAAPLVQVRFRCEVVATTRQGVIDQLAEILGGEGYFVSKKVSWEKTGDFRKRMNLSHDALQRILASPLCPAVELHRGRGRKQLLAINSNPVFEAFVVALRGATPKRVRGVQTWKPKTTLAQGRKSRKKPDHLLKRPRYKRYQTAPTK